MRRLLTHEYTRSIELLLGPEAAAVVEVSADVPQEGFDAIGSSILSISTQPVEAYERSADAIAAAALANNDTLADLAPCVAEETPTKSCFDQLAENVGPMFYRRPLTSAEIDELTDVAEFAHDWAEDEGLEPIGQGLHFELMALLQSPSFLYLTMVGDLDDETGHNLLTPHELAARLSFFLLGRTPDKALLDKASDGQLDTPEQIRSVAQAMVGTTEAWISLVTFYDELFRLRYLAETPKNAELFPEWTPEIASAMREETLMLLEDIMWTKNGDARQIFAADYTYANDALAEIYGIDEPDSDDLVKTSWPAKQNRAGLLSQGSFLAHQSTPHRSSPTKRGKFILGFVMCREIGPPPDDVIPELPEDPKEGATLQEQLEQHMEDPACNSCHGQTDPVGFAYEYFGPVGQYRTEDNGGQISGAGEVSYIGEWTNAAELGAILAEHEDTSQCMIRNFIRGKLGYTEENGQTPAIHDLDVAFGSDGYSIKSLLVEMAASPLFRYVAEPE